MRVFLVTLFALCHTFAIHAEESKGITTPTIQVSSRAKDSELNQFQGKFFIDYRFFKIGKGFPIPQVLQASCNGYLFTIPVNDSGSYTLDVAPGKYTFKLFASTFYEELYSDSIEIASKETVHLTAVFNYASEMMIVDKPVIYLYSEQKTTFDLRINPIGKMIFSYPNYSDNWQGKVGPSGEITIGKQNFPYLFWEAEQPTAFNSFSFATAVTIPKSQLLEQLELSLAQLELNDREKTDFITYWLPRMQIYDAVDLLWLQDTQVFDSIECDGFLINNIYIVFRENNGVYLEGTPENNLLKPVKRGKQTLIEWGGTEVKLRKMNL